MRILALDHGTKRIGMALSDPMGWTARGLGLLEVEGGDEAVLAALGRIVAAEEVEEVVVGVPRNMDGSVGSRAEEVLRFVDALRAALDVPVQTIDERLTSKEADAILARNRKRIPGSGGRPAAQRGERDVVAAQIILTDHLALRRPPPPSPPGPGESSGHSDT